MTSHDIARMIDHSLLMPDMTAEDVKNGARWRAGSRPRRYASGPAMWRSRSRCSAGAAWRLVIAFPHGYNQTEIKVLEARRAMDDGATELDMVLNIGRLRSGNHDYVCEDIEAVVRAAHQSGVIVKVILETGYLSDEEKVTACRLSAQAGADFVKTSTGYGPGRYTLHDIRLMAGAVEGRCRIKAAGGIRTLADVLAAREAGCDRVGATAIGPILEEAQQRFGK